MQDDSNHQIDSEKTYLLPLCNAKIKHKELFGNSDKVFLRPADLAKYGFPKPSVYDLVYTAPEKNNRFPFIKIGRKVLIPRLALEKWIISQAHIQEV